GPIEADALAAELAQHRARDRAAQRTVTGPHRDELVVTMGRGGMPAASCSTGEQKAMLIAMTLAHAELAAAGRPGVLLLDEVAAHLDPVRRAALFERLGSGGAQAWLTGTELAPFASIEADAAGCRVGGGAVERLGCLGLRAVSPRRARPWLHRRPWRRRALGFRRQSGGCGRPGSARACRRPPRGRTGPAPRHSV